MPDSYAAYRILESGANTGLEQALTQVRDRVGPAAECYVMAETLTTPFFDTWDAFTDWIAAQTESVTRGRLFGPLGEAQWRPRAGHTHLLLITDHPTTEQELTAAGFQSPQPVHTSRTEQLDLWGEWDAQTDLWREGRIPDALEYPVTGTPNQTRARLTVVYYSTDAHQDTFVRYSTLAP